MKKLVLVSDYSPYPCGVAEYSRYLAKHISQLKTYDFSVVSEGGKADVEDDFIVFDTYSRHTDFKTKIMSKLREIQPDIVHFQHLPLIFYDLPAFFALIKETSQLGAQIFITLHTAGYGKMEGIEDWKGFYEYLLTYASLIVHNKASQDSLSYYGISTEKVFIVPHGTEIMSLVSKKEARKRLNLPEDEFIYLMLGFIHLQKNYHTVIRAFNKLDTRNRNLKLLIAGMPGNNRWYNRLYSFGCKLLSGFSNKIAWHERFLDTDELALYFAAADVLLLPYWQKYPSSSGIFHLGLGAKIPMICSDSVKFSEVKELLTNNSLLSVPTFDVPQWVHSMNTVYENPTVLKNVTQQLFDYAEETSWENIAKRHAEIFSLDKT